MRRIGVGDASVAAVPSLARMTSITSMDDAASPSFAARSRVSARQS
jgi:hypothetical protein